MATGNTDKIRDYARREFIEPARRRGDTKVQIVARDVHKALRLQSRAPQVCSALRSKKFLEENRLALENAEGPAGGMSTTMKFTYRLLDRRAGPQLDSLLRLWGIGKEVFASLGGAEAFIRHEREHFYDSEDTA